MLIKLRPGTFIPFTENSGVDPHPQYLKVTDAEEAFFDALQTILVSGANITINFNDPTNKVTIDGIGGGGGGGGGSGAAPTVTLLTGTSNLPGFDIRLPVGVIPVAGWKIRLNPAPAIGTFSGAPFDYTLTAGDVAGYNTETREFTTPISWTTGAWPAGSYSSEISYFNPATESAKAIVPVTVASSSSSAFLLEDATFILLEDGTKILLEV